MKKILYWLILVPALILGNTFPEYRTRTITVKGDILNIYCEDLNADKQPDLLVLYTLTHYPDFRIQRFVSVFLQNKGTFSDTADQIICADHGEIVFDLADLNRDGMAELLFLKDDGCYVRTFRNSAFSKRAYHFIKARSIFLTHDKSKLNRYPLSFDMNGDSIPELMIPQIHHMDIYTRTDTGYASTHHLRLNQPLQLSGQRSHTIIVPLTDLVCEDFNGDGRKDLLFYQDLELNIFLNYYTIGQKPAERLIPPDFYYNVQARYLKLSTLDHLAPLSAFLEVKDLNCDGYTDLVLVQASRAQFPSHISQIQIYMNRYGKIRPLPDHIMTADNFGGEHIIRDFNRDGCQDIATLNFDIGIIQATKFLLTKKVKSSYNIYMMRPDHTYPQKPDSRIIFHRRLTLTDLTGSNLHSQSFDGDFDGDGVPDFIVATEHSRYEIYKGKGDGQYTKNSAHFITAPTSHRFIIKDINRDKRSDLILWYPDKPDRSGEILLLKSLSKVSE